MLDDFEAVLLKLRQQTSKLSHNPERVHGHCWCIVFDLQIDDFLRHGFLQRTIIANNIKITKPNWKTIYSGVAKVWREYICEFRKVVFLF